VRGSQSPRVGKGVLLSTPSDTAAHKPVLANFPEFDVKRADHDARPGLIDVQMINALLNAELDIADLSSECFLRDRHPPYGPKAYHSYAISDRKTAAL
jgi:hypothetical protein